MSFVCYFCYNKFAQKKNLNRHIEDNRCKSNDNLKINDIITKEIKSYQETIAQQNKLIEDLKRQISITGDRNVVGENNYCNNEINMKIEININPITKLDVNYLDTDKMKLLIEQYDNSKVLKNGIDVFSNDKINLLLGDYIKDIICDKEHPENHAVKYIKKRPPTYNALTEDSEGNTVTVIKGLKDTCELLSDPILDKLKIKMKEFIDKYKKDTEPDFDFMLYEDAIKQLKRELNKANVKKALGSVLKNDILNNIEMKLTGSIKPKVTLD
jgi:hypothetical protein